MTVNELSWGETGELTLYLDPIYKLFDSYNTPANTRFSPQDVQQWMEGAGEAGVIYFSLGSFQEAAGMPKQYRDALLGAFARLPQRVIVKYSGPALPLPPNVKVFDWLPQQDVLGE